MAPYSMDLRERVVAVHDRGEGNPKQLAARFCVGLAWVYRLLQRRRQTGSIAPKPHGGGQPRLFDADADERLRRAVQERPDATLEELRRDLGRGGSTAAVDRAVRRLGLTRKKSRPAPPSRTGRN
jgi:transposase